ncbi:BMP family ABC transporter substrate-binding protein [Ornithinibacillus sp. L9]|uniref:BMP family ABC transporter substrate-binding protein n=1 Tax=Ornithinibacillus caprae TaxID=2678566 RepID=A0A6N8FQH2_9BACI|nr:BMP family ABC transporter substrate-binding protein [Ornithinibacillus caprae]MUK90587.1 BMP family ABC transporter substrate-binding protein [Ornithinibacillus caprae]
MKKRYIVLITMVATLLLFTGCSGETKQGNIQKVGLLLEGKITDQAWGEKGYKGLLNIKEKYEVDVEYKEEVITEEEIKETVEEFARDGVNLIFGHSSTYGKPFFELSNEYPDVHFVYFNGTYYNDNVTSLTFNSHAMGFFAGMLASEMSTTNQVGIIAAYQWQPEIEGFYEGVKYQNPTTDVQMSFIYDWNEYQIALEMYEDMKEQNVDVFYPAGDAFSEQVIKRASEDGLYAIGFVSDQYELDPNTVLTSTVQRVDRLYSLTAEKFSKGDLEGEILTFDFKDDYISFGEFSPEVPEDFQVTLNDAIEEYTETGFLPNQ